jgi:tetratricopeptide (TPR) repeat protein
MNTLSLTESLFNRGRELLHWHRPVEARRLLEQVIALAEPDFALQAHLLLADWELKQQRFRKARQQLHAAIKLQPNDAEVYYRYAVALDADMNAAPQRAWKAIRWAMRLNRLEPKYWALYGQIALRLNRRSIARLAFRHVSQYTTLAANVLAEVIDGLCALGLKRAAYQRLLAARFQNPHDANVQRLLEQFQLGEVCQAQENNAASDLLPFPQSDEARATIVRHDRGSKVTPHLFRLPSGGFPKYRRS